MMKITFKMWKTYFSVYFLIYVFSPTESYGQYDQICTNSYNEEACNVISGNKSYVCTEETASKADCFLNMDKGISRLAIMDPEQSLLASALVSDRVIVIGTVSTEIPPYQTVVIIRKPYNGFESLKGKNFCHPGYSHDEAITKYVLEEFELKIISLNNSFCDTDENMTVAEKNVKAVSNFFASSCKPGPWTTDSELDTKWKSTYSNLCDLCGPQKCATIYNVPFNDTLTCLTKNSGDVALTTLRHAQIFFSQSVNVESFQYLCPNGTVSSGLKPCIWTKQLDPLIITEGNVTDFARNYIRTHLQNHGIETAVTKSLEQIFALKKTDKITLLDNPVPLKTYVETFRSIPSVQNNSNCNMTLKWCTLSDNAQKKCLWLQQAAANYGLKPSIDCVPNHVDESCAGDIKAEKADFAFINITYDSMAKQSGLEAIAYPEDVDAKLISVLIVLRNDRSDINHLKDLEGKRACFPEYGGKEWQAFMDAIRNNGLLPISCENDKIFGDFVGSSCLPGAKSRSCDSDFETREKLCAQCIPISNRLTAKYCNADEGNKYYTSDGALRCLDDESADYAVISVNEVAPSTNTSMYRVLCKNGSLARIPGLLVDERAPLTVIATGEVVARNDSSKRDDIVLLLREIEAVFGGNPGAVFDAFGVFDGSKNSLLPDTKLGLAFGDDVSIYVKNLQTLMKNSQECHVPISVSRASYNVILPTALLLMGFLILRF
ncbi:unnamed protein product [Phaedon cochleariae]|uniref:Transferrin-like domain-containing protein n=1 Tax=Phaedon cochleariae TaxID=80249 RepID=A0A9N9SKN1_PHACE|nr:unnamed protein product [Phaedon cochleariae]